MKTIHLHRDQALKCFIEDFFLYLQIVYLLGDLYSQKSFFVSFIHDKSTNTISKLVNIDFSAKYYNQTTTCKLNKALLHLFVFLLYFIAYYCFLIIKKYTKVSLIYDFHFFSLCCQ